MIFRNRRHIGKVKLMPARSFGVAFQTKKYRRKKAVSFLKRLILLGLAVAGVGTVVLTVIVLFLLQSLPKVETISTYIPAETTKIYSEDGVVLADLHQEENRIVMPIEKISPILLKTVIAVEDTDFYFHHGINIKGIMRAVVKNMITLRFAEGASTITQQLARNLFLTQKKKIIRKISEMILAFEIERKYTKTEILEMYLNQVYWGHNAYGIESASQQYFGKTANDLTLAESAMLVGLLKGPELYSPLKNFTLAKKRQKTVLQRMRVINLIDEATFRKAYDETLIFQPKKRYRYKAPFFTSYIVEKLKQMYGEDELYISGMKVFTTLNYEKQKEAEAIVAKWIDEGKKDYWFKEEGVASLNFTQAAILALEPSTGYIKVMVGGVDFNQTQFNRCTQSTRQPGSAFKPVVYLAALEKGFSPGSIVDDSPVTFHTYEGPYSPINYTKEFLGPITLRKALEQSINVVAIKLNSMIGPQNVVNVGKRLGITSPMQPVLSLPLGANEVTMMELTSVYGVFANDGIRVEPAGILKIEDRDGILLYKNKIQEKRVFDSNLIALLVDMMKGIVDYGTGQAAKLPRPVAGKTGTTSDYKDAWFVGFVPQLVCAVWVGNDDNTPMNKVTGGLIPAKMWNDFMKFGLRDVKRLDFGKPRGIVSKVINIKTGKLATDKTPKELVSDEKFWSGKEPKDIDNTKYDVSQNINIEKKEEEEIKDFFNIKQ